MISTITSSTIAAISTTDLTLIGIILLIGFLIQKELFSSAEGSRYQKLSRAVNIAIVPLLFVFGLAVVLKIVEILG